MSSRTDARARPRTHENRAGVLRRDGLLREEAFMAGKWRSAASGATVAVTDPATGAAIGSVPDMGVAETRAAIAAADTAFPAWRALLPQERARHLCAWFNLIVASRHDLAALMTLEQGKPLAESLGEIDYAASFVEWFAEEAKRLDGAVIASHLPNRLMTVRREPVGVVACVTPWNFPAAMLTRKAAAALGVGCTVVARPASETPFTALALAELADRAGLPAGVFNVVTGAPKPIVGELCANPV
ncbi:MAG: aldehyde dehydrogenase family protein, partial [Bauldia sp.]